MADEAQVAAVRVLVNGRSPRGLPVTAGWTSAARAAFLDHIAMTGDAEAAAEAVGLPVAGAYALRRRDARFAGQWHKALSAGYDRIEAAVMRRALGIAPAAGQGEVDLATAMMLLDRRGGGGETPATAKDRAAERKRTEAELSRLLKTFGKRAGSAVKAEAGDDGAAG
jgi:hypothetical protein